MSSILDQASDWGKQFLRSDLDAENAIKRLLFARKKIGIAFSGGGARGAYEVGVWKALREMGFEIEGAVGASVGAINAAAVTRGDYDLLEHLWVELEMGHIFKLFRKLNKKTLQDVKFQDLTTIIQEIFHDRGVDFTPLKEILRSFGDESKIRDSEVEFGLVVVSITDRKPIFLYKEDMPEGTIVDYVIASATYPFFKPHTFNGKKYTDGGLYDNLPYSMLLKKDINYILGVDVSTSLMSFLKRKAPPGVTDYLYSIVFPSKPLGSPFMFEGKHIKELIQLGYEDGMRFFEF